MIGRLLALTCTIILGLAAPALGVTCSATVSNINFGSISVRSGATNQSTGTVQINCSNLLVSAVGVCLDFGAGSGGAASGLSPRYMLRSDGSQLAYDLSTSNGGAALSSVYVLVPLVLNTTLGSTSFTIYSNIVSNSVAVGTGTYSSTFSDPADVSMQYGVLSCGLLGTTGTVSNFTVSANVVASCQVSSAILGFGQVPSQVTSPVDAQTTINVACTDQTPYSVLLGLGTGAGVTDPAHRKMASGANTLDYGLYQDAAHTTPWGNQSTNDVSAVGNGSTQSFSVYGQIHSGQTVPVGSYADTVVVTVAY
ncbi:hypothetical protein U879_08440 [Defluviimonas sp. 20V17]|uniref:Spore coat protein U n=1 Tax=Allgaiera indica TaxID=765699 RepID=A0AAN4UXW3_9RHOB|nr:spore coat U domain-containing protein [Allgaiera indica]KDB04126.1 hypothetical protein U879_08440 [Defluviimonas sp. 20V17]GHE06091.1 spore coat protein U [Allgaiera indica]SDX84544.1 Spore coat protein U (SCPU) domain-containing protein [Allgaiera indica]